MNVSATINGQNVNVVQINSDGCNLHTIFIDASGNLKVTKGYIDYSPSVSATLIGTSAKSN